MAVTAHSTPLVYVESDIPEGVTLAEWRRSRRAGQARRTPVLTAVGRVARRPVVRELALAVIAYLIYEGARLLTAGSYPSALANAHQVVALERDLGLNVEGTVQRAFLDSPLLTVLNYVYLVAQNLILPASLVFLYRVNRATYRTLRNTLLATWCFGPGLRAVPGRPAAPGRHRDHRHRLERQPAEDGVGHHTSATTSSRRCRACMSASRSRSASPSRRRCAPRCCGPLALLWGPLVLLAVVATGNHFVFDVVAGLLITVVGYGVGRVVANGWPARSTALVHALRTRGSVEPAVAAA